MFVVVDPKAGQRAGERVWFVGRVSIVLALYATSSGGRVLAGEVPEDRADLIRGFIKPHPHYREAAPGELEGVAQPGERPTPAAPVAPDSPTTDGLRAMAIRLGWSIMDIAGTAMGDQPGEAGGRSERTGLTLAEMTLSTPPKIWHEVADDSYPWELSDWRPPGMGWVPPRVASKRPPPSEDTPPPVDEDDDPTGEVPPPLDDDPTPPSEQPTDADPTPTPAGDDVDPAVALGYPADKVDAARAAALELKEKRGEYSFQAINYILGKLDLPTVNGAMLNALLGIKNTE